MQKDMATTRSMWTDGWPRVVLGDGVIGPWSLVTESMAHFTWQGKNVLQVFGANAIMKMV